ncbi:M15 family metallopeptidase [Dysgonomonas sp. ZJ279]|uniref:M15 family metallopeptidase n=1 Tax=Dysgonomonas sp. ZJ279 TaxID=2709796 RepID=UPI0013EB10A1
MIKNNRVNKYWAIVLFLIFISGTTSPLQAQQAGKKLSTIEAHLQKSGMVNIHTLDSTIRVELKYATTDNFTNVILYDTLSNAYLHPLAAKKLAKAQKYLKELNPKLTLLVYDAARPLSVQRKMYKVVQGTPQAPYVANPSRTGLHNYGMAVDLTICDLNGKPLEMGTPFDHLGYAAQINKEAELVQKGIITPAHVKNRELLRKVMVSAGYQTIRGEWWHFNAVPLTEAKQSYKVIQ